MVVKKISFPTPLTDVEDIYDDNIDVFVDLENGRSNEYKRHFRVVTKMFNFPYKKLTSIFYLSCTNVDS